MLLTLLVFWVLKFFLLEFLFCIYWDDYMYFIMLMWELHWLIFWMWNQPYVPGINPSWLWCVLPFCIVPTLFPNFLRLFVSVFMKDIDRSLLKAYIFFSFIHSFNKYVFNTYNMPGTMLGPKRKNLCPHEFTF